MRPIDWIKIAGVATPIIVGIVVAVVFVLKLEGRISSLETQVSEMNQEINRVAAERVPSGAVVAFGDKCPEGWDSYHTAYGRFLLGAGNDDKAYTLGMQGGASTHTLTVSELPNHNHDKEGELLLVSHTGADTVHAPTDDTGRKEINIRYGFKMVSMGGNEPHDNMPPYFVVNFCEKK